MRRCRSAASEAQTESLTQQLVDALLDVAEPDIAPAGVMCLPSLTHRASKRRSAPAASPSIAICISRAIWRVSPPVVDPDWDRRVAVLMPDCSSAPTVRPSHASIRASGPSRTNGANTWAGARGERLRSFEPRLSAARLSDLGDLDGAVVTTVIGPGAAHIARWWQCPERRGHVLASAMLHDVIARAFADGFASLAARQRAQHRRSPSMNRLDSRGRALRPAGRGVAIPHA